MQLTNKKLIKSYKAILTSSLNAKSILEAEAQKVDEKYKALAEQEKKDISEQLKSLEAQIDMCNKLIGEPECPVETEETTESEEIPEEVVEEKVVDTLFPENNEEKVDEPDFVDPAEDEGSEFDGAGFTDDDNEPDNWPDQSETQDAEGEPTAESDGVTINDEWPAIPEEW